MYGYGPWHHCMPKCETKCVGEMVKKYKLYKTCCFNMIEVCSYCGLEYEHGYPGCPRCGLGGGHLFFGGYR
ncbi:MAG: hypothetical protein P4N41_23025 [Negativicutes bacterium]|nr:hypothetical protein [Negativicutes bacterium]